MIGGAAVSHTHTATPRIIINNGSQPDRPPYHSARVNFFFFFLNILITNKKVGDSVSYEQLQL